jgi:hypothetical protein
MLTAVEVINNFGSLVPAIYHITRGFFALAGLVTFVVALSAYQSGKLGGQQVSKGTCVMIAVVGSMMFSTGVLSRVGVASLLESSVDYSILSSYSEQSSEDAADVAFYVVTYYLRLFSYFLSFSTLNTVKNGLIYHKEGWVSKSIGMYILSIGLLGIATLANVFGGLFGYSTIGTNYFTLD